MRFVGIQVNDASSKDTRISSLGMVCDLMNPTKVPDKFLTWELVKPTTGASRPARNFESSCGGGHEQHNGSKWDTWLMYFEQPVQQWHSAC